MVLGADGAGAAAGFRGQGVAVQGARFPGLIRGEGQVPHAHLKAAFHGATVHLLDDKGAAQLDGRRVHILGEAHADGAVGGHVGNRHAVHFHLLAFRAGGHAHPLATHAAEGVEIQLVAGGAGETRVDGGGERPALHVLALHVGGQGEGQLIGAVERVQVHQRVAAQVGDVRGGLDHVLHTVIHRVVRGDHQRVAVQFPGKRLVHAALGEAQADTLDDAVRVQRFGEQQYDGLAGDHAVGELAGLPGQLPAAVVLGQRLQHRAGLIIQRVRGGGLVAVGLHAEAQQTVVVLHAEHARFHHADGVGAQHAVTHDGAAHQFHMQQVLGERAVGPGIVGGGGQIQEQTQVLGRVRGSRGGVGEQVTGGVGDHFHGYVAGVKAHRHLAADEDFQGVAYQPGTACHA